MSSSLFFLVVVVKLFDYFWKPYSLFSNFVLTVFWCSTSYTVIVVHWSMLMEPVNAPARWWPGACLKCVSGLPRLEKTLNFLRYIHNFDLVLRYGSDIKEGNWLQLLFYFILLVGKVASVIGKFFLSCGSCFRLKFSRIALWPKRLQLDSKSDLATNGLILGFSVKKWLLSLTSYLYGLKFAIIVQLLMVFEDIKNFRCLVWGVFCSVL